MGRLSRKKWTYRDIGYLNKGGITDLLDNMIKENYRINDEEYDKICLDGSDEELDTLLTEKPTFYEKRQIIMLLNKYIKYDND